MVKRQVPCEANSGASPPDWSSSSLPQPPEPQSEPVSFGPSTASPASPPDPPVPEKPSGEWHPEFYPELPPDFLDWKEEDLFDLVLQQALAYFGKVKDADASIGAAVRFAN
eukprot:3005865-Alexandrium_andersonii.AAC.1